MYLMLKVKRYFITGLTAILMTTCLSATVFAEPSSQDNLSSKKNRSFNHQLKMVQSLEKEPDVEFIYNDGNGNSSFIPSKHVKDKALFEAKLDKFNAQDNYTLFLFDSKRATYNGFGLTNTFSTNVDVEGGGTFADYKITFRGTSAASWGGATPYYADSINQSDTFSFNYVGLNASISYPPGLGFSGGNSSATITYPEIKNQWRYDHTYSGIVGKAYIITAAIRSNTVTFLFGTSTVNISTYDSEIVW